MTTKNNIALTVLLPIIIVGGSIGLYFALKPKKCPDGITNIPRNPITGKRDISACPSVETDGGTPPPSGAGNYGGAETIDSGKGCKFPLKNQSGASGDEGSQKCVRKVKQALAPEINEMGWFEEDIYGEKVQKALDDFLEDEVSSNEQPLAKLKQAFGGCGNWLQGYDNCKLFNDQYKHLLEKRNIPVAWNQELNQWV
jgi:hypothetical protein